MLITGELHFPFADRVHFCGVEVTKVVVLVLAWSNLEGGESPGGISAAERRVRATCENNAKSGVTRSIAKK
jgi:hypothetical protein